MLSSAKQTFILRKLLPVSREKFAVIVAEETLCLPLSQEKKKKKSTALAIFYFLTLVQASSVDMWLSAPETS